MNPAFGLVLWLQGLGVGDSTAALRARLYIEAHLQRYGAVSDSGLKDRVTRIRAIRALGIGGVRLDFEWSQIEPVRGVWRWGRMDSTLAELRDEGLSAYGVMHFSPDWARPPNTRRGHRPVVSGSAPAGDTAFGAFAAMAARRYRRVIDRWEVWNEPNVPAFWSHVVGGVNQPPDARDYLRLFTVARDSILAGNPQALVSPAGLSSLGWGTARSVPDPLSSARRLEAPPAHVYLRELIADGLNNSIVAIHPYSALPPGVAPPHSAVPIFPVLVLDSVFAVLRAADRLSTAIWVTEWGVQVADSMAPAQAARWLEDGLRELLCRPQIQFVTLYTLSDTEDNGRYNLLDSSGRPTTLGIALHTFLTRWRGCF